MNTHFVKKQKRRESNTNPINVIFKTKNKNKKKVKKQKEWRSCRDSEKEEIMKCHKNVIVRCDFETLRNKSHF